MDEKRHHCFLGKKPGVTDRACDDVAKHDNTEAGDANAAQDHQQVFEGVERAPFEMALLVQDQAVETHHGISGISARMRRAGGSRASRPGPTDYWTLRTSPRTFTALGPRSDASLSWIGLLICWKPLLSTSLTTFTPIFSSFASAWCSRSKATAGSFWLTSSAAACTHFFCSSVRLLQALSLMNSAALFASCSVSERTGAGS